MRSTQSLGRLRAATSRRSLAQSWPHQQLLINVSTSFEGSQRADGG
jgi:hypothetical protein